MVTHGIKHLFSVINMKYFPKGGVMVVVGPFKVLHKANNLIDSNYQETRKQDHMYNMRKMKILCLCL